MKTGTLSLAFGLEEVSNLNFHVDIGGVRSERRLRVRVGRGERDARGL